MDRNIAERERFGIDASPAAIEAARNDPQGVRTGHCWWTRDERETISQKVLAFQAVPNVDALVGPAAAAFAGIQHDLTLPLGGWHVGFTSTPELFVEQLRHEYLYPDRLVPFLALRSLAELREIEQDLLSSKDEFAARAMELWGAEVDVLNNRVDVYVDDVQAGAAEWLAGRFPGTNLIGGIVPGHAVLAGALKVGGDQLVVHKPRP